MDDSYRKRQFNPEDGGGKRGHRSKRTKTLLIEAAAAAADVVDESFASKDITNSTEYIPVSLDELTGLASLKHDPDCPLCTHGFGKPKNPGKYPLHNQLWCCYADNLNQIPDIELYQRFVQVHYKLFVKPYKKASKKIKKKYKDKIPLRLTFEKCQEHFTSHAYFLETELDHDFRKLRKLVNALEKHLGKKDKNNPDKDPIPDTELSKEFRAALKDKQTTLKLIMLEKKKN